MEGPLVFDPGGVGERRRGLRRRGWVLSAALGMDRLACLPCWLAHGFAGDPLEELALGHCKVGRTRGVSFLAD